MNKRKITIIIPTVSSINNSSIIHSYQEWNNSESIYIQFVALLNNKKIDPGKKSHIESFGNYEIVHVANDRYFGSCEENLYRVQDFCGLFKDYVFCVGDHDFIDWDGLLKSLDFFESRDLDAMGWNILGKQLTSDGSYVGLEAISPIEISSCANQYVHTLLAGDMLPSPIAFPALISMYGPIDWAAYIGNHFFKKEVFNKLLQHKFSEYVYSFVYKQMQFFTQNHLRYGFYNNSVIHRLSDDFLKLKNSNNATAISWLEEHRLVLGNNRIFMVANFKHLLELHNDRLFDLISNSLCLAQSPTELYEIKYNLHYFLLYIMQCAENSINDKLTGKSFYFPHESTPGSLTELNYINSFFGKLIECLNKKNSYADLNMHKQITIDLGEIVILLNQYLSFNTKSDTFLNIAIDKIRNLHLLLARDELMLVNDAAFINYLRESTNQAT